MKYNESMHAQGLLRIFSQSNTCDMCPACFHDRAHYIEVDHTRKCEVCWQFIHHGSSSSCPCNVFGPQRAGRLTWLALEEKGYLE